MSNPIKVGDIIRPLNRTHGLVPARAPGEPVAVTEIISAYSATVRTADGKVHLLGDYEIVRRLQYVSLDPDQWLNGVTPTLVSASILPGRPLQGFYWGYDQRGPVEEPDPLHRNCLVEEIFEDHEGVLVLVHIDGHITRLPTTDTLFWWLPC